MDTNCAALPRNSKYPDLAGAAVGGLEERPHEDRELAKLGLKQYKFCVHNVELKKSVADDTDDDFRAMMLAVFGGPKQVMIGNKCSRKMKRKMKRKTQNQS